MNPLKLYIHSPIPPDKTGIADYCFELLPKLSQYAQVKVVSSGREIDHDCLKEIEKIGLQLISEQEWIQDLTQHVDMIDIYQIGNNLHHSRILERALARPGLAVIHDLSLIGLLGQLDSATYARFTEYELGHSARRYLDARNRYEIYGWQEFLIKNLGLLVDSSSAVLVHSKYAQKLIKRRYRNQNVLFTEHHVAEVFRSEFKIENPASRKFGNKADSRTGFIIGTFGFLTPPKRIDWLIDGFKKFLSSGGDAFLLLAGEPHKDTDIHNLLRGIPEDKYLVTGFLKEEEMRSLMLSIDIQFNLRFPSVGESSGTLTRAMGLGKPCVIIDHEAFSDYADDHVIKLHLNDRVPDQIFSVLSSYASKKSLYQAMAERGRAWVLKNATIDGSVKKYLDAAKISYEYRSSSSRYIRNITDDICEHLRLEIDASEYDGETYGEKIARKIINDAFISDLSFKFNFELVCVDGFEAVLDISDACNISSSKRKLIFFISSMEESAENVKTAIENITLRKFDSVVILMLSANLTHTRPHPHRFVDEVSYGNEVWGSMVLRSRSNPIVKCVVAAPKLQKILGQDVKYSSFSSTLLGFEAI